MYKCLDCGAEFDEPKRFIIMHYEVDTRQEEYLTVCPECFLSDIEEMKLCPACKENWITSNKDICNECTYTLYDALNRAIDRVKYDLGCEVKPLMPTVEKWIESL
jgi:DNA-directed RNA polymerase subunit RPC12/RpoP